MEFITDLYDYSLIYYPNIFFLTALLLLIIVIFIFIKTLYWITRKIFEVYEAYRKQKRLRHFRISITSLLEKLIFIIKFVVMFLVTLLYKLQCYINKNLNHLELMSKKIIKIIKKEIFISCIIAGLFMVALPVYAIEYSFAWPGILPDNPLYKVKTLRNKIIERLIIHPVRKIEFDLLMADKTLYASKLLLDKGKFSLARDTALKGENYFTILVADYAKIVAQDDTLPEELRIRIDLAYVAHQQLISYLYDKAPEYDKKTYQNIDFFSDENYFNLKTFQNLQ